MSDPADGSASELTYPLGAAARMTGLTPDTLRAWERRYAVVVPLRTPGGTRRYTAADLETLRLVKAAVDAGHRISQVAGLPRDELLGITARGAPREGATAADPSDAILDALKRLDAEESERLIALQLAALGPRRFARDVASPLLERVGDAWSRGELCVASEHLATSVLRSLLGASLRPTLRGGAGAPIVFGTLPGERHEMGLLIAAITAAAVGGRVVYLGADLPVEEFVRVVEATGAEAIAISMVAQPPADSVPHLEALRAALPARVEMWVGGSLAAHAGDLTRIDVIDSFESFEHRVELYGLESGRPGV